jgi:hypothetical protein
MVPDEARVANSNDLYIGVELNVGPGVRAAVNLCDGAGAGVAYTMNTTPTI